MELGPFGFAQGSSPGQDSFPPLPGPNSLRKKYVLHPRLTLAD